MWIVQYQSINARILALQNEILPNILCMAKYSNRV